MSTATHIARERWRAQLEDYHADLLGSVGLDQDAAAQKANADLRRIEAGMAEHLETVRMAFLAHPDDMAAKAAYKTASSELRDLRRHWRSLGELAGTRRPAIGLNQFTEPTDEELTS